MNKKPTTSSRRKHMTPIAVDGDAVHDEQQHESTGGQRYFVQSLARGLDVVRAFGTDGQGLGLAEIARRTNMSRAAARRYLLTLRDIGYVEAHGSRFELKPRLLELGYSYFSSLPLWKVADPILTELVNVLHESCSVTVLDLPDVVYVARVPVKQLITANVSVGTRFPACVTSTGRVLLSALPEEEFERFLSGLEIKPRTKYTVTNKNKLRAIIATVRRQGYALINQELELRLQSLAVPIRNRAGRVIAALNVSTFAGRTDDFVERYLVSLLAASKNVTASLPY